jgi:hypothetical protein
MNGGIINSVTRLHLVDYFYWIILRCTDPWILNFWICLKYIHVTSYLKIDPVILNLFTYCWLWRKGNRRKLTTKSSFDTFYRISSLYIIYSKYPLVLRSIFMHNIHVLCSIFMHNIHVFHTVCETWLLRSMGVIQSRKMNRPLVFRKQLLAS